MGERRRHHDPAATIRRGSFAGPLIALVVLIAGLSATVVIWDQLGRDQMENAQRVMDQRTAVARAAVQTETERYRALIETTAAGIATDEHLTWEDWDAATGPLASAGLAGASSVAYVVPSTTAAIPATQALWRSRGAEGLVLQPVATTDDHYFSIFSRQLSSAGRQRDGIDVAASPEASNALDLSQRLSQPTVSDTYVLLRDRNLPAARQQHSFIFVAPLWTRASQPAFRGWIVLGLRSQDFLTGVLATVGQGQLDGQLLATGRDDSRPVVASYPVPGRADLVRVSDFPVADRQWRLITRADSGRLSGARTGLPLAVLVGGVLMSLLLAGLVYVLATGRTRALAKVEEATADLRAADEQSRRQAGLLAAVMASIGDGVGVVDEKGAFLLHNPAARELLGVSDDVDGPEDWQGHYGLFRPDGRTPFPTDELPLIRALNGESSDGVEMLVRNPAKPEGVLVSVDGRPLDPSAGLPGAVAVFHDITELRRYETDLAVFAGVVAHDLKAPLAIVRGHGEAALEDLADLVAADQPGGPLVDDIRVALSRIVGGVDRMAALIDTLLAYTTARDAPLRTADMNPGALVAEVVHDRTAHLPESIRPDVYIGPLPIVRADALMLRHVLDNLIGNALKYVRAGTVARVDVTGQAGADGWACIEVCDRGIGIPDSDKPEVFESFHRAHAADGYAGTGLGLAICRRIVERHGGEIGVGDNPGGGTRFHFTLPVPVPANEQEPVMPDTEPPASALAPGEDDEAVARAALERALAERAAMENSRLPGLSALPAAEPSAHDPAAARLRAPVPDHHPTSAGSD